MQPSGILPTQAVTRAEYRLQPTQNLELPWLGRQAHAPGLAPHVHLCAGALAAPEGQSPSAPQHCWGVGGARAPPPCTLRKRKKWGRARELNLWDTSAPSTVLCTGLAHPHRSQGVGTPVIPTVQSR